MNSCQQSVCYQHCVIRIGLPPAACILGMICNIRAIVEGQVMPAYELAILGAHLLSTKAETQSVLGSGKDCAGLLTCTGHVSQVQHSRHVPRPSQCSQRHTQSPSYTPPASPQGNGMVSPCRQGVHNIEAHRA